MDGYHTLGESAVIFPSAFSYVHSTKKVADSCESYQHTEHSLIEKGTHYAFN